MEETLNPKTRPGEGFENELARRIQLGDLVSDSEFDNLYSDRIRILSGIHWTPVKIAVRAAALATNEGQMTVLDVGSGAGKFCSIGALTTRASFTGIEQREYLVHAAQDIAKRLGAGGAQYVHGNAIDADWTGYQSIYLFNPFSENIDKSIHIDKSCELSVDLYVKYVRHTQWKLSKTSWGTTVVIYNRFGGELPPSFQCVHKEEINDLSLEVWRKK